MNWKPRAPFGVLADAVKRLSQRGIGPHEMAAAGPAYPYPDPERGRPPYPGYLPAEATSRNSVETTPEKLPGLRFMTQGKSARLPLGTKPQNKVLLRRRYAEPTPQPFGADEWALIDGLRSAGRVRVAAGSDCFQSPAELRDGRNWFFSVDGYATFDPMHRRGELTSGADLAKNPYVIGEIGRYPEGRAPWRDDLDQDILRQTMLFNKRHGYGPGSVGAVDARFVKSVVMEETGGEGNEYEFLRDPMRMYVPGDWTPDKARVTGQSGPIPYAELSPGEGLRAGLEWLHHRRQVRDGRGNSRWEGLWGAARRYNGRTDPSGGGDRAKAEGVAPNKRKPFSEWYADRVLANRESMRKRLPPSPRR